MGFCCLWLQIPRDGQAQPVRTTIIKPKREPKKSPEPKTQRPAWEAVENAVKSTLAQTKDYQAGDLITREEASKVLAELKKLGWEVQEQSPLSERMLSSGDEMVRQLRDKNGVRFMREISAVPEGFDRLDRLRRLPDGQKRMKELIADPGGSIMIQYLATTPGGKNLGRQLSSNKRGDFNASTKRIYTEAQLLAELKTRYDAESKNVQSPQP
jgi:hypothetical protein